MKYKIWDKQENLVTPTMEVLTPEQVFNKYPASQLNGFKFIICDAPISMGVFMEFETTKKQYKQLGANIQDGMTDEQVLQAIEEFENQPQIQEPTAEERIASYMEYELMLKLAKEEE